MPCYPRTWLSGVYLLLPALVVAADEPATEAMAPAAPWSWSAAYAGDLWSNTSGGLMRDNRYVQLLTLTADLDTGKAWGHAGGTAHVSALLHRNTFTAATGEAQTISNIDFDEGQQLFEAWYEQQAGGDHGASLKAGLYDLNSEFDHIDTAGLFLNSSHGIGKDFSQSGVNGPSIAPLSSLGLRLQRNASTHWILRAAVLDGVPGENGGRNRHNSIHLDGEDGTLLAAEADYTHSDDCRTGIGLWHYTRDLPLLKTGTAERGVSEGGYAFVDGAPFGSEVWRAWLRIGFADPDTNVFADYAGTGIVATHALWHDDDQIGLAVASVFAGDPWREAVQQAGGDSDRQETVVELTWLTAINGWLSLQPDVQYVVNPGIDPAVDDALAVGLRLKIALDGP